MWLSDVNSQKKKVWYEATAFAERVPEPSLVRDEMEVAQHGFAGRPRHLWDNPTDEGRGY